MATLLATRLSLEKGGSEVAEGDKMNVTVSDVFQGENFRSGLDVLVIEL
jgi:hypothetical protein